MYIVAHVGFRTETNLLGWPSSSPSAEHKNGLSYIKETNSEIHTPPSNKNKT